jgi:hypothetical protein
VIGAASGAASVLRVFEIVAELGVLDRYSEGAGFVEGCTGLDVA